MADGIDKNDGGLENPRNVQPEKKLDENIPSIEPDNLTPKQDPVNMEVHHHPDLHHKTKKWKEYFLEFLMIFLAVAMGFIAENIREHFADKEKEKQSIETIITGIASDTTQLNDVIASNELSLHYLNKFVKLKGSGVFENKTKREFYDDIANGSYNDVYFRS